MKRVLLLLLLAMCLSGCDFLSSVFGSKDKEACVTAKSGLRVRSEASTKAKHLGTVPYEETVEVIEKKEEPLTIAGKEGHWTKIEWKNIRGWAFGGFLQSSACSAGTQDATGTLHAAVKAGKTEQVKLLLAQGADVNARDKYDYTPLHWAAQNGRTGTAKLLIAKGAKVNAKKGSDINAAFNAAFRDVNYEYNSYTPLHAAVEKGRTEITRLLLAKGADVNARAQSGFEVDAFSYTPLHSAAEGGHAEIARMLLAKGANVNDGWSGEYDSSTPLHAAARGGHTELARMLISKGANVNDGGESGHTPLHKAARGGHTEIARMLISKGANVNAVEVGTTDAMNTTPLHDAAGGGHTEIARMLISKGAKVNARDVYGRTPLHYAAGGGHTETVKLLKEHGGKTGKN